MGEAIDLYEQLRCLFNPESQSYSDPKLAQYLLESIRRTGIVLQENYADTDAPATFFDVRREVEIAEKVMRISRQLNEIRNTLKNNRKELIQVLRFEFNSLRSTFIKEVQLLIKSEANQQQLLRAQLQQGFDNMANGIVRLHDDLEGVHGRLLKTVDGLRDVNASLQSVKRASDATHGRLDQLIKEGQILKNAIENVEKRVESNTKKMASLLESINKELKAEKRLNIKIGGFITKVTKSVESELSNLTAQNIKEWVTNPKQTFENTFQRLEKSAKVEFANLLVAINREWLFQLIQKAGLHLFMQRPRLISINPELPGEPIYYVNGVFTSREAARESGREISAKFGLPVFVIHNPSIVEAPFHTGRAATSYGPDDLSECIYDRLWPATFTNASWFMALLNGGRLQENVTTREVTHLLYHASKEGRKIRLIAHSQGTMIVRNAMFSCWILSADLNGNLTSVFAGSPLGDSEMPPKHGTNKIINDHSDPIAQVIGFRGHISKLNGTKHFFVENYLGKITAEMLGIQ